MNKLTINNLIFKCMLSDRLSDRMRYGAEAKQKVNELEETFNELIEKLTQASEKLLEASKIISDQTELLECCYSALGDRASDIVNTWQILKQRLKKKGLNNEHRELPDFKQNKQRVDSNNYE